jgi:hypothetical protein
LRGQGVVVVAPSMSFRETMRTKQSLDWDTEQNRTRNAKVSCSR